MRPYNDRKAAQISAYFALRSGGRINVLKLIKLVYLAQRSFVEKYDALMLYEKLVSMDNGPVNSLTLNHINGLAPDGGWAEFITDRDNNEVGLATQAITEDDLDELSRAELAVLAETWEKFGHMTQWELVELTHRECGEWEDPRGSSTPIPYERLLKALGKSDVAEIEKSWNDDRKLAQLLME